MNKNIISQFFSVDTVGIFKSFLGVPQEGVKYLTFNMYTTASKKNQNGGYDKIYTNMRVTLFDPMAIKRMLDCKEGDAVYVQGDAFLEKRTYEGKEYVNLVVTSRRCMFLRTEEEMWGENNQQYNPQENKTEFVEDNNTSQLSDDIPF